MVKELGFIPKISLNFYRIASEMLVSIFLINVHFVDIGVWIKLVEFFDSFNDICFLC